MSTETHNHAFATPGCHRLPMKSYPFGDRPQNFYFTAVQLELFIL